MLVNQMTPSQNASPLLVYAISRLRPEIFSHPVWVCFGNKEAAVALEIIDALSSMAENLQANDPSAACQVLLICAVYQNYAGQRHNASRTTQKALALAQSCGLSKETIWAIWGACAISLQHGNFEQAANHLVNLQAELNEQNEWILAGFVDALKYSLIQPVKIVAFNNSGSPSDRPFGDLLTLTYDGLLRWGFSTGITEDDMDDAHLIISNSVLPPTEDSYPPHVSSPQVIPASTSEKVPTDHLVGQTTTVIPVAVHMLGPFNMTIGDLGVKLPASRGLSLLKYLLLHYKQNTPREVLMDIFWPDTEPETARNNLNVTMHNLRRALRTATNLSVIVYEDGAYGLDPNLQVWLDVYEFEICVRAGQRLETKNQLSTAVAEYEAAISLYQGDFLEQSPYEEWPILERERLRIVYLDTLDHLSQIYFNQERYAACIMICQFITVRDRCHEDAHCLLMRCYSRQGQYYLALRQYQSCVEALRAELEVEPAPETTKLYDQIRHRERIQSD
jgi:DNA-binding SARP family transcriptional activator